MSATEKRDRSSSNCSLATCWSSASSAAAGRWQLAIDSAFRYAVRMRALAEGAKRRRSQV